MSHSIFSPKNSSDIIIRLLHLAPTNTRKWGSMQIEEMFWHCRQQLAFVLHPPEEVKVLRTPFRNNIVRYLAIHVIPWPKGADTAPSLNVAITKPQIGTFIAEKNLLLVALHQVLEMETVTATHPLFGKLGKKDWGCLIEKHLNHHLKQFGG